MISREEDYKNYKSFDFKVEDLEMKKQNGRYEKKQKVYTICQQYFEILISSQSLEFEVEIRR